MANKKEFKKYVTYLANNVCQDMMIEYYNVENANLELIDEAVIDVLTAAESAILKSNFQFDKSLSAFDNARQYRSEKAKFNRNLFHKINAEYVAAIDNALKKFNSAIPQVVKDKNRTLA